LLSRNCLKIISFLFVILIFTGCGGGGSGSTTFTVASSSGEIIFAGETTDLAVTTDATFPYTIRLEVASEGGTARIVNDYSDRTEFKWSTLEEGSYEITVSRRNVLNGSVTNTVLNLEVVSPSPGLPAVVGTDHPLVALYVIPAQGSSVPVSVQFRELGTGIFSSTPVKEASTTNSTYFYIAGLKASTTYEAQHVFADDRGGLTSRGALMQFNTGSLDIQIPDYSVISPSGMDTSVDDPFVLFNPIFGTEEVPRFSFATDLDGNLIWYLPSDPGVPQARVNRIVTGGTFLIEESEYLREIDLVGNTVRETNLQRVNEQLNGMGSPEILGFHHESRRLPNGHTLVLGYIEAIYDNVPGEKGPTNLLADMVIVLDENLQVAWVWNAFEHMDINRPAILGQVCEVDGPGCPSNLQLGEEANDWLHSNAVEYCAADGNLIISVRHQDWIIKIAYENGAGDGHVIWRLGEGGDFALNSKDPHPWFSHAHDPNYIDDNVIAVYDNGNTRSELYDENYSRGQVYELDEKNMTATLVHNFDLGNYSPALGSAQQLSNGNFFFNSGFHVPPPRTTTADEVLPDGTLDHGIYVDTAVYRSFRLRDLYTAPHYWME